MQPRGISIGELILNSIGEMELVALAGVLAKVAIALMACKVAWHLYWNRPGAMGGQIPGEMGWPIIGQSLAFFAKAP
jgi:hypothetical protein